MKYFFILLFCVFSFADDLSDADKLIQSLVPVAVWKIENPKIIGTGFSITPHLVMMSFHTLQRFLQTGSIRDISLFRDGQTVKAVRIHSVSALYDLALIEIDSTAFYLQMGQEIPSSSETVFLYGYPEGSLTQIKSISPVIYKEGFYSFFVDYPQLSGASGSPVFNKQGQVVGIFSQGVSNLAAQSIGLNEIKSFIDGKIGILCLNSVNCVEKEMENIKELAQHGNALAQFRWADMLYFGIGLAKDNQEALKWYQKSAEQGFEKSNIRIAFIYMGVEGVKRDFIESIKWLKKIEADPEAQFNLGLLYEKVFQDDEQSERYLSLAGGAGLISAQNILQRRRERHTCSNSFVSLMRQKGIEVY